jgi:hypothetical protein
VKPDGSAKAPALPPGLGYGQDIFVKSPHRIRKPASEAILRPALVPEKNGTRALNEQRSKVSIATPADAAKDCPVAGRNLLRPQITTLYEGGAITDRSDLAYRSASNWSVLL